MQFNEKKNKLKVLLFGLMIWVIMCIFFIEIHPLIIWDTDDWTCISTIRRAIPIWGAWNPSRVFPEIALPLCAYIGAKCLVPITNDYIWSLSCIFGIVLSSFITLYVLAFLNLIRKKFNLEVDKSCEISVLFLLCHFLMFRSQINNNVYLFWSTDVTCYFYYTIPCLLNLILVLYLETNDELLSFQSKQAWMKKGLLLVFLYIAIFSNLFCSYILAIWAGCKILFDIVSNIRIFDFRKFIKNNLSYFLVIILWFISAIYELSGGRATSTYNEAGSIGATLQILGERFYSVNFVFICVAIIVPSIAIWIALKKNMNHYEMNFALKILFAMIAGLFYLVILASMTFPSYISRMDVLLGICSGILIIICTAFISMIKAYPWIEFIIPITVFVLAFEIPSGARTFAESNASGIDSVICKQIDDYIVQQVEAAVREGKTELELHVPAWGDEYWPFGTYGRNSFAHSLYVHGIITKEVETTLIPDDEINKKYGME